MTPAAPASDQTPNPSTGPRTEAGKQISRLNARRHGITAQVALMPDDERAAFDQFCEPIIQDLAPGNAIERQYAASIAEGLWRLARLNAYENNLMSLEIAKNADNPLAGDNIQIADALHMAEGFAKHSEVFNRLGLYEQRIRRGIEKSTQLLEAAQEKRRIAEVREKYARKPEPAELPRRPQTMPTPMSAAAQPTPSSALPICPVPPVTPPSLPVRLQSHPGDPSAQPNQRAA